MMTHPADEHWTLYLRLLECLLLLLLALCLLVLAGSLSPEQAGEFLGALVSALATGLAKNRLRRA